jgi:hypothetical protein
MAAVPAWSWPVRAAQFDRSATLSVAERVALDTLGWGVRRWPEHLEDSRLRQWQAVHRLVLPLAQAVESLEVPSSPVSKPLPHQQFQTPMMRADNTAHLKKAAAARREHTRQRAIDALDHLQSNGAAVTVAGLARTAGVARSWIYTQPDLLDRINTQPQSTRAAANLRTRASEESWQRRIGLAHQRIKELSEENKQLRTQLAIAHCQRRAGQITASRTPSTTQNS